MKKNKTAIIFYKDHSTLIKKHILKNINLRIMIVEDPFSKIYLIPLIKTLFSFNFNPKFFFYEYWKNIIIFYNVKFCITAIDNSGFFQKLAYLSQTINRKIFFFSIQNGLRRKKLNLPDYNSIHFCHGEYDLRLLKKMNKKKNKIIKTGSLFYNINYKKNSKKLKKKKTITFISQIDRSSLISKYAEHPDNYFLRKKTKLFLKNIKKFLKDNKNFHLNILTYENSFEERNFFKSNLQNIDNYKIIKKENIYYNYQLIDISDCNITVNSTLGFESLVCNKVIFLDNMSHPSYKALNPDLFGNPPFILRNNSYNQLKRKIINFSNMKYGDFYKKYKKEISYFMYKKNTKALNIVRKNITENLLD